MDVAEFWDQVRSALGLDEPQATATVARVIQAIIVVLLTIGVAHWLGGWVRRAAMAGRVYAEVAVLLSRATAVAVYAAGGTLVLATIGASWAAIAAVRNVVKRTPTSSTRPSIAPTRTRSPIRNGRSTRM